LAPFLGGFFSKYAISGYLVDPPLPSRIKPGVASMEFLSRFEKKMGFWLALFQNMPKVSIW